MAISKPEVYNGKEPFVFISYSHKDTDRVIPIIEKLQLKGVRIWYDNGISAGSHWDKQIPRRIGECACVVCFVSPNFVQSENCQDEVFLAKEEKKGPVVAYLENTQLPIELKYHIGRLHALNLAQLGSVQALVDQLVESELIKSCRAVSVPTVNNQTAPNTVAPPQKSSKSSAMQLIRTGVQLSGRLSDAEIANMSGEALFRKSNEVRKQSKAMQYTNESFWLMEASARKGYKSAYLEMASFWRSEAVSYTSARGYGIDYSKAVEYMENAIFWQKKYLSTLAFAFDSDSKENKEFFKKNLAEMEAKLKEYKKHLKASR